MSRLLFAVARGTRREGVGNLDEKYYEGKL